MNVYKHVFYNSKSQPLPALSYAVLPQPLIMLKQPLVLGPIIQVPKVTQKLKYLLPKGLANYPYKQKSV